MSAYTDGRPAPVISLRPSETLDFDGPEQGLSDKLTGFAQNLKSLEQSLTQERAINRKLRADWGKTQEQLVAQLREAQSRIKELEFESNRRGDAVQGAQRTEAELRSRTKTVEGDLVRVREELSRYRKAWAGVLQREREARMIIVDGEQIKKTLVDLERLNQLLQESVAQERAARGQLQRLSKHRDLELRNARARLEHAESRAGDQGKAHAEESARLRDALEERMAQARREVHELRKAIDTVRNERAAENERFARRLAEERKTRERIEWEMQRELHKNESENERARSRIAFLEKQFTDLTQKGRKFVSRLRSRFQSQRKRIQALTRMRNEERARSQAMSFYLLEEKQRYDLALDRLLSLSPFDYDRIQEEIDALRKEHDSGAVIAGPPTPAD